MWRGGHVRVCACMCVIKCRHVCVSVHMCMHAHVCVHACLYFVIVVLCKFLCWAICSHGEMAHKIIL